MTWRLFLAVAVPEATRRRLAEWARGHAGKGWRPVGERQIHLTLRFLGETPATRAEAILHAVERAVAAAEPFAVPIRGWGVFPGPSRARILWAGVDDRDGRLARLAAAVEAAVVAAGFPPETRPFRAHLTLARAGRGVGRPALPGRPNGTEPVFGSLPVSEVALMRSHLLPEGARYERVGAAGLGAAGEERAER
ncbi:MAG: RNA 2',3'-cyclic phosphodiesterase [Acidobacteria bacterium]|nr:MAG: RNA 2',3'-cyclic phosphodiesterase [Acidobacteriota bacterium]